MSTSHRKDFRTSDLYLAAFLKTQDGVTLDDTTRRSGQVTFIFHYDKETDIDDLKMSYFNRTAEVSALDFTDEIKSLKSVIHQR